MNKHRLQRKSKKIQGRGSDVLKDKAFLYDKLKKIDGSSLAFVHDKLNEILSKKKKHGAGLKFL